jgi:hypothetical protein
MLTRAYIKKVARLRDQIGELRPGFLQDAASGIEGAPEPFRPVVSENKVALTDKTVARVRVGVESQSIEKARVARK